MLRYDAATRRLARDSDPEPGRSGLIGRGPDPVSIDMKGKFLMRLAAIATAVSLAVAGPALAASDPGVKGPVVGTVVIAAKSANVGVGWSWGDGTLHYHHHSYPFSVSGLNVAAVGFSTVIGHGRVYNLKHLRDFDGTYYESHGEATLGTGIGGSLLINGNGVQIRVNDVTKGAQLAGSASGIELKLK